MQNTDKPSATKIRDVMSRDVEIVSPDTPLDEIAKKMLRRDCGCVIVAKNDRLIGMITNRDLALRCIAESHHPAEVKAQQVMTPDILYCRDTDDADAVTRNMGQNKVRRLAVLDANKRLVGIVTLGDLAMHSNHRLCGETLGNICRIAA